MRCTLGRIRSFLGRRRAGVVGCAARARSNRVRSLGLVELQGARKGFQNAF
jgi:hypothetical protein